MAEVYRNTLTAVEWYLAHGMQVVPLHPRSKRPIPRDWPAFEIAREAAEGWFDNGQNIGVKTGAPSGDRVDVDLDVPEAAKIAERFLPKTLTSGRETKPRTHWWYTSPGAPSLTLKDIDSETLVELRSDGRQTAVAPSVHPDGDRYVWHIEVGQKMTRIDAEKLLRSVRELTTATLIARHVPPRGGRHDFALALAGFLLRRLELDTVLEIMEAAWHAANADSREALRDLEGIVRDTTEKLESGEQVQGGPTLEEYVRGLPKAVSRIWGWRVDKHEDRPSIAGEPSRNGHEEGYRLTDLGNAERLVARHGEDLRYVHPWGRWLVYDGKRWAVDDTGEVARRAKETVRSIYGEAERAADSKELARHAMRSEAANRIEAMIGRARSEEGIPAKPGELDADRWLLNVENGTIDLRTGELREHRREDLITKLTPIGYYPDAECPKFLAFLERILPSEALRGFVQRFVGHCLTGDVSEDVLTFFYGTGANGKSTLIELILALLGDYAQQAAPDLLLSKKGSHPTELAELKDARFVASVELDDGRRLSEGLVKQLTGGERIRARFMRQDFFEFEPTHKVVLAANHKPEIRGTDHAIWRRIRLVPFDVTIPKEKQDKRLPERLRDELPGILVWAVKGCLGWQGEGLGEPDEVKAATKSYREEMDVLAAFIEECCVVSEDAYAPAADLYEAYTDWCEASGERPEKQRRFGARLTERGFESFRYTSGAHKDRKGWRGIAPRANHPDPNDGNGGGNHDPNGGDDRPLSGQTADDRPADEFGLPIGKSPDEGERSGRSGQKTRIRSSETPSRYTNPEKRSASSASSAEGSKRRLTEDETRRVQHLMAQGMDPKIARAEVLGEGTDLLTDEAMIRALQASTRGLTAEEVAEAMGVPVEKARERLRKQADEWEIVEPHKGRYTTPDNESFRRWDEAIL